MKQTYQDALKALNEAAWAAQKLSRGETLDNETVYRINSVCRETDKLVDAL